jgi:hypothetical protein
LAAFDCRPGDGQPDLLRRRPTSRGAERLGARTAQVVFTVAPRTPFLMAMWHRGQAVPAQSDRSPVMVPHAYDRLSPCDRAA